jgi:hypothetical protein
MKWIALFLLLGIPSVTSAQNPNDPTTYPETIVVNSSKVETEVVGSATQEQRPPLFPSPVPERPTVTTKNKTETYYILVGVIGDTQYTLQGGPGVPLGTFKAKITNGQYADILVTRGDGSRYNVGFKIIGQEKIPSVASEQRDGKPVAAEASHEPVEVFYWANELNRMCQEVPASVGAALPAFTKDALTSPGLLDILRAKVDQGVCVGYILGRAEALSEINSPDAVHAEKTGKVCFPLHNPGDELVASVKEKLAKDSALHDKQLPASIAVDLALKELFPCPTQ